MASCMRGASTTSTVTIGKCCGWIQRRLTDLLGSKFQVPVPFKVCAQNRNPEPEPGTRNPEPGTMTFPISPPIEPMLAKLADELPAGGGLLYEPKWDGFRAIVFRAGADVFI